MTEPTASPDVTELLPCPLCDMYLRVATDPRLVGMLQHPPNLHCPISAVCFVNIPSNLAAWNRRAPDLALRQEVERLRQDRDSQQREAIKALERATTAEASLRLATQRRENVVEECAKVADAHTFNDHELAQATDHGLGGDAAAREIAAALRALQPKEN